MEPASKRKRGNTSNEQTLNHTSGKCSLIRKIRKNICQEPVQPVITLPQTNFDALPIEMKERILNLLDLDGMRTGRQVCQEFKRILNSKLAFHLVLSDETIESVRSFDCNQPVQELVVQDFSTRIAPMTCSRSRFAKNVSHLIFRTGEGSFIQSPPPHISTSSTYWWLLDGEWVPGAGTSQHNIITLFRIYPNIESLTIGAMSFEKITQPSLLRGIRLECLTRLELSFGDDMDDVLIEDRSSILPYQAFLRIYFPALITFFYSCKASYKPFQLLLDVYGFVARHNQTLKYLHIDSYETYMFLPNDAMNPAASTERYQELRTDLLNLQLKQLYLRVMTFVPESFSRWKTLEGDFLTSQVQVEKLEIFWIEELHPTLNFLPHCKDTLVELTIISNLLDLEIHQEWENASKFDCILLKDCKHLKKLEVDFAEWDFFQECTRARVKNFQHLPKSLKTLTFGGFVPWQESNILSRNLTSLEVFTCHGCGECAENVRVVYDFLKNSNVCSINLLHDSCLMVYNFATRLSNCGISVCLLDSEGVTVSVDRSIFQRECIELEV